MSAITQPIGKALGGLLDNPLTGFLLPGSKGFTKTINKATGNSLGLNAKAPGQRRAIAAPQSPGQPRRRFRTLLTDGGFDPQYQSSAPSLLGGAASTLG
jgi:hypothetical protein